LDALKQMLDSLTYTENGITSHITVDTTNVHVDPTVTIPTTDGVLQEAAKAAAAQKLIDQSISTVSLSLTSAGVLTISGTIPIGKTAALNTAITAIKALTGITSVVSTCSEQVPTDTLLSNLVTWIKDFSSTGTTGDFQRNLSNATTASQSFNDTERENLNRVMFIFQEFYQSASTLLSNMNDIISKMISMLTRQ
jgi:ABC-type branched-subunit amino acid transport system ATPase component